MTSTEKDDMHLWIEILQRVSKQGININNITFTKPTIVTSSDACKHGLGGYNTEGLAWRYKLPSELPNKLLIILLEFNAAAITIYLTISKSGTTHIILAFTDNSSAVGWLYKASFKTFQPAHDKVARWLASTMIRHNSALYSQHIKGSHNMIDDILSRDTHIPSELLTLTFRMILPEQTPQNFVIYPLFPELASWIASLAQSLTNPQELPVAQPRSKLGHLTDGNDSYKEWASKMSSLKNRTENNVHTSCQYLPVAAEEMSMAKTTKQVITGGTVNSTIFNVRLSFRNTMRSDSALDVDGEPSLFLTRQFSEYIDKDPSSKQQKIPSNIRFRNITTK